MADSPDPHLVCERAKSTLRARILTTRRGVDPLTRAAWDAALVRALVAELGPGNATIAGYVPLGDEPGDRTLPDTLAALCQRVLLPVLRHDLDLEWSEYRGPEHLRRQPSGVLESTEPSLGRDAIRAAEVIVVPALAVGLDGRRLGRGGGSYDRALTRAHPDARILAVLYPGEVLDDLPAMSHDRPVTTAVTIRDDGVHVIRF